MTTLAYQKALRPELPTHFVPKEYREFRDTLIEVNRILESGIERRFIMRKMECAGIDPSRKAAGRFYERTQRAVRYSVLLAMSDYAHRELAVRVSDSLLLQWFTTTDGLVPRPYSKSAIERFEKAFEKEEIAQLIHEVNRAVSDRETAAELILQEELDLTHLWADTTCIKADIHYPVDWVLLRDATRTLIKSIPVIRRHGLKHRIGPPQRFITEINKLVMQMTHTRKKKHGAKMRKVIRQAHERIIGERRVANTEKILSL